MTHTFAKMLWMGSTARLLARRVADKWWDTDEPPVPLPEAVSAYAGEVWNAHRPGEDVRFPAKFVSRRQNGEMGTVTNSREELVKNSAQLGVILRWRPKA